VERNWAELTDHDLMRRCARKDEAALGELHRRHASLCRRRALDVLRNPSLAEEAVQDAYLDLWNGAAAFDPDRAALRTWLCVLVHRRTVDIARREARHHADDANRPAPEPASYTAEEVLTLQINRRSVSAAVGCLSPVQRQVIELAYWGGLSQSQIATRCRVPIGTIKSRTFDALAKLSSLLAASAMR
jgi:RNA polymerase sigma factor (sigma-70 family)